MNHVLCRIRYFMIRDVPHYYGVFWVLMTMCALHLSCGFQNSKNRREIIYIILTILTRLSTDILFSDNIHVYNNILPACVFCELIVFNSIVKTLFSTHLYSSLVVNLLYMCILTSDISMVLGVLWARNGDT